MAVVINPSIIRISIRDIADIVTYFLYNNNIRTLSKLLILNTAEDILNCIPFE